MIQKVKKTKIEVIQAGMGVRVSGYEMANKVGSIAEQYDLPVLAMVSGTGLSAVLLSEIQRGDEKIINAVKAFPVPAIAEKILQEHPMQPDDRLRRLPPMPEVLFDKNHEEAKAKKLTEILVVASFVEVWLAKNGHQTPVGINYLEKLQPSHPAEIYGAMLAGVNYIVMGAGIPNQIPSILDQLAQNEPATYAVDLDGTDEKAYVTFDPSSIIPKSQQRPLERPRFFPVVTSNVLAKYLVEKVGGIDGLIIELPEAGGHNAPPRGKQRDEDGVPLYGPKDYPKLDELKKLGIPFYLAGGFGSQEGYQAALAKGAAGVQIGTLFVPTAESGYLQEYADQILDQIDNDVLEVEARYEFPSGYPFKIAKISGSVSEPAVYAQRKRRCRYGYLRTYYKDKQTGKIKGRCPAEPVAIFVSKGGSEAETVGQQCLCSCLLAAAGCGPQGEKPLFTLGDNFIPIKDIKRRPDGRYGVEEVLLYLFSLSTAGQPQIE